MKVRRTLKIPVPNSGALQVLKTHIVITAEQHRDVKKGSGLASKAGIPAKHAFKSMNKIFILC